MKFEEIPLQHHLRLDTTRILNGQKQDGNFQEPRIFVLFFYREETELRPRPFFRACVPQLIRG